MWDSIVNKQPPWLYRIVNSDTGNLGIRFKKYLINKGYWSDEEDQKLEFELNEYVTEAFKKVEESGLVPLMDIFKYHYHEMTSNLIDQYEEYKAYLAEVK